MKVGNSSFMHITKLGERERKKIEDGRLICEKINKWKMKNF